MALSSFRRYDVQARYACVCSIVSIAPLAAAAFATWQRYDANLGQIVYGSVGYFVPAFVACVLLSALPGAIGVMLGISSAGQRRNDKQSYSWIGFFVGGSAVTLCVILLIAFYMLRLERPI